MMKENSIDDIEFSLPSILLKGLKNGECSPPQYLALHGWLDNAASFIPLMEYLPNVVAIDWPGHGLSAHRSVDAHYHFIDYVYDLLLLIEQNNWPPLNIIGHSMGGMIASVFAAAFPEKIQSLTLIDAIGFVTDDEANTVSNLRDGLLSRLRVYKKQQHSTKSANPTKLTKPTKTKLHSSLESAINARLKVSDLEYLQAKLLVERGTESTASGIAWRSDSRLMTKSPLRLTVKQATHIMQAIKSPIQVILGTDGMPLMQEKLSFYQSCVPHISSSQLAGGHHVHMEQPQATAELISDFIKNI